MSESRGARSAGLSNPQLTILRVAAEEIGDGYGFGGAWYDSNSDNGDAEGFFLVLARAGDLPIQWSVSNGRP